MILQRGEPAPEGGTREGAPPAGGAREGAPSAGGGAERRGERAALQTGAVSATDAGQGAPHSQHTGQTVSSRFSERHRQIRGSSSSSFANTGIFA